MLFLFAATGTAFGQAGLPWERTAKPTPAASAPVQESQLPLARARIEAAGPAWVGQAVPIIIEVIVPTWFKGAPRFPDLDAPNAVILSPESAVNFVVQSGDKTFSGQSRRYLVFPQVKGTLTVPSAKIEVTYVLPGGKSSAPTMLTSPPLRLEARIPPGTEKGKYFLTTDSFQVSQSLSGKVDNLHVGDVITRTVTMTAENTVGVSIPPLRFEAPQGLRLYPGSPKVAETAERGKIEATRTESVTYVPEKEGQYNLPEITILWWNPQTKTMNRVSLPRITLAVQAGSAFKIEQFASSQTDEGPTKKVGPGLRVRLLKGVKWFLALLSIIVMLLFLKRVILGKGMTLGSYIAQRRRRKAESEAVYFGRFRKTSLSNDPLATLIQLMRWLDRVNTDSSVPTLLGFVSRGGVPELGAEAGKLEHLLFAPPKAEQPQGPTEWTGRTLYALLAETRKLLLKKSSRKHHTSPLVENINYGRD